jgi:outer membrane protein assembly factor BamE (lipoprotein component of BamABCDE complex)
MTPRRSARVAILAVVLAGACLLGADFGRPDPASFALGQTTEQEIRTRFGTPTGQTSARVGDKVVTTLRYAYAEARSVAVPVRIMAYAFHEGRLVGFDYMSSFTADQTLFDELAVKRITRGVSTRAEVLALMGKPAGQFIYPSSYVATPGHHADVYSHSRSEKLPSGVTLETTTKVLTVTFDEHDVVAETHLVVTTSSKPLKLTPDTMHPPPGGLS